MTSGRRRVPPRRAIVAFTIGATLLTGVPACSSDDGDGDTAVLDQVAPTKADIARDAGISFPASTADFRLVRISGDQIDVTFTLTPADVDGFASGSGIVLTDGERSITHASPLWDVAIVGEFAGGSSTVDGVRRRAEVVGSEDAATVTVRLSVTKS